MSGSKNIQALLTLALACGAVGGAAADEAAKPARHSCVLAEWDKPPPRGVIPPKLISPAQEFDATAPAAEWDKWLVEYRKVYGEKVEFVFGGGTVSRDGSFSNIEVLCAEPGESHNSAFVSFLSTFKFEPARKGKRLVDYPNRLFVLDFTEIITDPSTCRPKPIPTLPTGQKVPTETITDRDLDSLMVHREQPVYPQASVDAGQEGTVIIKATYAASGVVTSASVICATLPGVFDEAALTAVRKWRAVTSKRLERPARITIDFTFNEPGAALPRGSDNEPFPCSVANTCDSGVRIP